MTYRLRLSLTLLLAATIPVAALAYLIRQEVTQRLTSQYVRVAESAITQTEASLRADDRQIRSTLAALAQATVDDNRFRRAAVDGRREERGYLLDYATNLMRLTELEMLQIQDEDGRVLSSGHFRNEFDRIDTAVPRLIPDGALTLARVRSPEGPFVVLVDADTISMGGRQFSIAGGRRIDDILPDASARQANLTIELVTDNRLPTRSATAVTDRDHPQSSASSHSDRAAPAAGEGIVRRLSVPLIDSTRDTVVTAVFTTSHDLGGLAELKAGVDRLFAIVVTVTGIVSVLIALWLAGRVSRPIAELAENASRIDLDRLNVVFKTDRKDEIGALSRVLRKMTERLRTSAAAIRDAERRATRGELARQVNHDIKNGLAPVRNVFRHLHEVSEKEPQKMAAVFREREGTLESGMSYLEKLAANYARLYPTVEPSRTDVNALIRQVVGDVTTGGFSHIHAKVSGSAAVYADPISVRRILENLIGNAVDAARGTGGEVSVTSEQTLSGAGAPVIRIVVADTGPGMNDEEVAKAFEDFYTSKERGTGLGLSIVRRLVMDLDGSVRVESSKGEGTRFIVDLPEMRGI